MNKEKLEKLKFIDSEGKIMEDDILAKLKKYKDLKYLTERKIEEYNNEILIYNLIIKDLDQLLLNEIKVFLND